MLDITRSMTPSTVVNALEKETLFVKEITLHAFDIYGLFESNYFLSGSWAIFRSQEAVFSEWQSQT
jgi:hypothetical protein